MARNVVRNIPCMSSAVAGAAVDVSDLNTMTVEVNASGTLTLQLQGTIDGTNWVAIGSAITNPTGPSTVAVSGLWMQIRMNTTAYTSGTPTAAVVGQPQ